MKRSLALLLLLTLAAPVAADPCGMVPPIWDGQGPALTRVGEQITYVFFKDGIESFVIRPGFSGKVDEFGMLIPFPTPPAIRKVEDDIFGHIARAVDPPEVVVDVTPYDEMMRVMESAAPAGADMDGGLEFAREQVVVLKEEAVGMYEVAVLAAGSADALTRWLDDHGYQYPDGMGPVAQDYVNLGWCFVAVKTRVGQKKGVTPRAGMKTADSKLPAGATFDGNVQAMGFRFKTPELVVPMRLSAFNAGELHNVVYLLTDQPVRAKDFDSQLVKRQLKGDELYRNVTGLLPLRVIGGTYDDIPEARKRSLPQERDPKPHNGFARDLFASDLLAVRLGQLALPHEEREKVLLRIGERLGLRGEEIDALHREELQRAKDAAVEDALQDLAAMTLTVIDGDFPREQLAAENISFEPWSMSGEVNAPRVYDAKRKGPAPETEGVTYGPDVSPAPRGKWLVIGLVCVLALVITVIMNKKAGKAA